MNTRYTVSLACMLIVPALVVSCEEKRTTPEELLKEELKAYKDLAAAIGGCSKMDELPTLESTVKELFETQQRINKVWEAMSPEQKAEVSQMKKGKYKTEINEVGCMFRTAWEKFEDLLGEEGCAKFEPVLQEFMKATQAGPIK